MKRVQPIRSKSATELASYLALETADGAVIDFRAKLNEKIIQVVEKECLTHAEVAKLAKTSRTRVTAIINHNTATFHPILCYAFWQL